MEVWVRKLIGWKVSAGNKCTACSVTLHTATSCCARTNVHEIGAQAHVYSGAVHSVIYPKHGANVIPDFSTCTIFISVLRRALYSSLLSFISYAEYNKYYV